MTDSSVAANFHKSFNVETDISLKVTFDAKILFNIITDKADVTLSEVLNSCVGVDACFLQDFF